MKTLVFSDTHLTDKFDPELFDYIAELVESADQVVINGDFWDGYLTTFDAFCNSQWNKLFPLLKKKQAVYIFGNHDQQEHMDERCNLFSDTQTMMLSFKSGKKNIVIEHGHRISPSENQLFPFLKPSLIRPFFAAATLFYESYLPLKRSFDFLYRNTTCVMHQKRITSYIKKHRKKDTIYIVGHTHIFKFDNSINFISCALTEAGENSCVIIEDGNVSPLFYKYD